MSKSAPLLAWEGWAGVLTLKVCFLLLTPKGLMFSRGVGVDMFLGGCLVMVDTTCHTLWGNGQ